MQNPKNEIPSIITTLASTRSASALAQTISRYFTPDAQFWHPLCRSATREEILGVYQWYRIMSPQTRSRVLSVIYDETLNVLIVEVVQMFHIRYNPFPPSKARLNVRLTLREVNGLHYIARQEDFYHPTVCH
ncbi:hypothetical protein K503DRAFT_175773 [Rhizopogon vinicolor AM-OR11-026]|uniref:SigF-like NTF2-like domain-containing protein n=1 Tax=Rhizopogon vinicolor AM-OR11-026 TaxID=1314800 RepID=A0A1B7N094_9AGAM|nr:hypothetical protein K503DRAFT_175773 [Rhizopogon vinicolor AM-OR11-026]